MDTKIYIQDAFRYLVCNIGECVVRQVDGYWTIRMNGKRFKQIAFHDRKVYTFECKAESGTVTVSFKRAY
jgi:hypothetical protein